MSTYTVEISNIPSQAQPKNLLGAIKKQIGYYTFKNRVNIVNGKCVLIFDSLEGYNAMLSSNIQLFGHRVTVKPLNNNRNRGPINKSITPPDLNRNKKPLPYRNNKRNYVSERNRKFVPTNNLNRVSNSRGITTSSASKPYQRPVSPKRNSINSHHDRKNSATVAISSQMTNFEYNSDLDYALEDDPNLKYDNGIDYSYSDDSGGGKWENGNGAYDGYSDGQKWKDDNDTYDGYSDGQKWKDDNGAYDDYSDGNDGDKWRDVYGNCPDDNYWAWEDDNGVYHNYSKEICMKIESSSINSQVFFTNEEWKYSIIRTGVSCGVQKNSSTGKIRKIRKNFKKEENLITLKENIKLCTTPNWWSHSKSVQEGSFINLDINSPLVKNIIETFQGTLKSSCKIFSVQGVQNPHLWKMYHCAREALKSNLNEQYLYHGTSIDVIKSICTQGFLRDFGEVMAYGKGIYFAKNAEYSASPRYSKPDSNGYQYMLLCRVIVGESCIGKGDYKVPLCKPNTNIHYESMVDNLNNPSIFVISKDYHSYPEFIVKFKTNSNSEPQYSMRPNNNSNYNQYSTPNSISRSTNNYSSGLGNPVKISTTNSTLISTSNSTKNSIPISAVISTSNATSNSTKTSIPISITSSTSNSTLNSLPISTLNSLPISTTSSITNSAPSSTSNSTKNSTTTTTNSTPISTSNYTTYHTSNYTGNSIPISTTSSATRSTTNATSNYTGNSIPISNTSSATRSTTNATPNYTSNYTGNSIPISNTSSTTRSTTRSTTSSTSSSTSSCTVM